MNDLDKELLVVFDGENDLICTMDEGRETIDTVATALSCEADDIETERIYLWSMEPHAIRAFLDDVVEYATVSDAALAVIEAVTEELG